MFFNVNLVSFLFVVMEIQGYVDRVGGVYGFLVVWVCREGGGEGDMVLKDAVRKGSKGGI